MQPIAEFAKPLFRDAEIRIFGTADAPLFVANDIAKLLDIKNARDAISKFENYEIGGVGITDTLGGKQESTLLTEAGLYSLVLKSRKPIAREFKKWVLTEVLPSIRKTGVYNPDPATDKPPVRETIDHDIATRELTMDEQLYLAQVAAAVRSDGVSEIITVIPAPGYQPVQPARITDMTDINDYCDKPCVYLLHLRDYDYKFGVTGEIDVRIAAHECDFKQHESNVSIVKLWKCSSMKIMRVVENKIKLLAKQKNMLVTKYGKREIITTADADYFIGCITGYVDKQNEFDDRAYKIRKIELSIEKLRLENERALIAKEQAAIDDMKERMRLNATSLSNLYLTAHNRQFPGEHP